MPSQNENAEWCSGIAGAGCYWGTVDDNDNIHSNTIFPVGQAGGSEWLDIDRVITQQFNGRAFGVIHNVRTKETVEFYKWGLIDETTSGNGHWAVLQPNNTGNPQMDYGMADSFGRFFPHSGMGKMGPDGSIAMKREYHSAGPFDLIQPDGSRQEFFNWECYNLLNYGGGKLVWMDPNANFHVAGGLPQPKFVRKRSGPFIFTLINGVWWQIYNTETGNIIHQVDEEWGHVVCTGDFFRPCAVTLPDGRTRIMWGTTQDEAGWHLGAWTRDVNVGKIKLSTSVSVPVPTPIPVNNEIMIPAFERPMWQAPYFSHHTRYGDTPSNLHVGNAIYVDWDDADINRFLGFGQPLIMNVGHPQALTGGLLNLIVMWYVSSGNIQELVNKTNQQLPELPITAYLDGDDWPNDDPFDDDRIWPNIQAYRFPDESLVNFVARVESVIETVSKYNRPMCLTTRFDDFNGQSTIANIIECMPFYDKWLRYYNFVVHMPFADRRGNGIAKSGTLWNWARMFQYAIPFGRPNRFDYWKPTGSTIESVLKNKLGQSRASVVLEPYLREYILGISPNPPNPPIPEPEKPPVGDDEEPDINEPLLRMFVEQAWNDYNLATEHNRGAALNWIAWTYNEEVKAEHVGLSSKPWEAHVEQPHTGVKIAHDIVQVKPPEGKFHSTKYDTFTDGGPILGVAGEHNSDQRPWVPAVKP